MSESARFSSFFAAKLFIPNGRKSFIRCFSSHQERIRGPFSRSFPLVPTREERIGRNGLRFRKRSSPEATAGIRLLSRSHATRGTHSTRLSSRCASAPWEAPGCKQGRRDADIHAVGRRDEEPRRRSTDFRRSKRRCTIRLPGSGANPRYGDVIRAAGRIDWLCRRPAEGIPFRRKRSTCDHLEQTGEGLLSLHRFDRVLEETFDFSE